MMALTKRDKAIIDDLNKFRVMDRDSIATLHFGNLRNPQRAANNILLRLLRDKEIQRSTAFQPYVYFGPDVTMKKNSAKIGHFLAIVNVYKEMLQHEQVETFLVEPKYGQKGTVEPDIFCFYRKTPFFIEVQRSIYSEKQMAEKLDRYKELFHSGILEEEIWQPNDRTLFPHVLILSEQHFALEKYPFRIFQANSFSQFIQSLQKPSQTTNATPISAGGIKIKIGG
jgi:hypothetical protein